MLVAPVAKGSFYWRRTLYEPSFERSRPVGSERVAPLFVLGCSRCGADYSYERWHTWATAEKGKTNVRPKGGNIYALPARRLLLCLLFGSVRAESVPFGRIGPVRSGSNRSLSVRSGRSGRVGPARIASVHSSWFFCSFRGFYCSGVYK